MRYRKLRKGGRLERVKPTSLCETPWRASDVPQQEGDFKLCGGGKAHEGSFGEGRGSTVRGRPFEGIKTRRAAASERG